jgi:hypothetical protein
MLRMEGKAIFALSPPALFGSRLAQDTSRSSQYRSTPMHIPLVIALLALLVFMLLPMLDRPTGSEINATGVRAYWVRIARWSKK